MVKTTVHGNPKWTRDEVILALELCLRKRRRPLSKTDQELIELLGLLRSIHPNSTVNRKPALQNPDDVIFKPQNLHQLTTGSDLKNVVTLDPEVWAESGQDYERVRHLLSVVRSNLHCLTSDDDNDSDVELKKGKLITRVHRSKERNKKLRSTVISSRKRRGQLSCDAYATKEPTEDDDLNLSTFEVHHVIPFSETDVGKTQLKDVAFLCASCHRLIHRIIQVTEDSDSIN